MKKSILFVLIGLISSVNTYAQCVMCKETVANSISENGQNYGVGLNSGIFWLMAFPYILFVIIVSLLIYFRNKKKKNTQLEQVI